MSNSSKVQRSQKKASWGTGVYILENTPSPGGDISQCQSFGGKIWKGQEKKVENVEEKGRKGKENESRGSKRVK
jgi:hypothetical protein